MIEFIKDKKKYFSVILTLIVIVSVIGTTYSLYLKSETTKNFNYNTGLIDLIFTESKQISLDSAFPMNDSEGNNSSPYTLKIKNTGNLTYKFDLKMISENDQNVINNRYIKVKINDNLPHTLYDTDNVIASNVIIQPDEEITFRINLWLDIDTPNTELGKKFIAKIISNGEAIYKTLDESGANHPKLTDDMISVYYDEDEDTWKKADSSNLQENYLWYDYDQKYWANTIILKESDKQIFDLTGNNNLQINNPTVNNGNLILEDTYLDLGLSTHDFEQISTILKIKIKNFDNHQVFFVSNNNISYYYDYNTNKFMFTEGNNTISSKEINLKENVWYTVGFTYDKEVVKFYLDGQLISVSDLTGTINSSKSFKVGTDKENKYISSLIIDSIYIYEDILSEEIFKNNFDVSSNIIYDKLVCGYNEFTPMTLKEYYLNSPLGTVIRNEDIYSSYVWIPRFKYKLWNITGEDNIDSYGAYQKGIDIIFERDKNSTGVIYCQDNICYKDEEMTIPVTKEDNDKYYTHTAFGDDLTGIWVGKYELSKNKGNKSGSEILFSSSLSEYYQIANELGDNYHIIKNTEWGAITYLSHSKYGTCQDNSCIDVLPNDTTTSGSNIKDSTTNNFYGVFDMAGSAIELTMSNYDDTLNEFLLNEQSLNRFDFNLYHGNTFILGDATKELSLTNGSWYGASNIMIDESKNLLTRGGAIDNNNPSIFSYYASSNLDNEEVSTRLVIR